MPPEERVVVPLRSARVMRWAAFLAALSAVAVLTATVAFIVTWDPRHAAGAAVPLVLGVLALVLLRNPGRIEADAQGAIPVWAPKAHRAFRWQDVRAGRLAMSGRTAWLTVTLLDGSSATLPLAPKPARALAVKLKAWCPAIEVDGL